MKNKETYWTKTASGWQIKTSFAGDSSMHDLYNISPEESIDPGTQDQMDHEDYIKGLMNELKDLLLSGDMDEAASSPKAREIIEELHANNISADDILFYITNKGKNSNPVSDEEIKGIM